MAHNHTPGKWEIMPHETFDGAFNIVRYTNNLKLVGVVLAEVLGRNKEENAANAALICRAPDLLAENEALKAERDYLVAKVAELNERLTAYRQGVLLTTDSPPETTVHWQDDDFFAGIEDDSE